MPTDKVVGSFFNESDLEVDYERLCSWRNWRISHIEELKSRLNTKWDEAFSLKWLEKNDIYEALNLNFIEERRLQKMSLQEKKKSKVVAVEEGEDEEEAVIEESFQADILQATMISKLETTLPEGESSRRAKEEEVYKEQLMDYELTPPCTPTVILSDVEVDDENIVSGMVVGLEAIGEDWEAPIGASKELKVENATELPRSCQKNPDSA